MKAKNLPKNTPQAESITYSDEVSTTVAKAPANAVLLHKTNGKLKDLIRVAREVSGQKPLIINRFDFKAADFDRDRPFIEMHDLAKTNQKHPDEQIALSSRAVFAVILEHGEHIHRMSYAAATHHYNALIIDLSTPEMMKHLKVLKLTSLLDELKEKQQKFEELRVAKASSEATAIDHEKFDEVVEQIQDTTENLINAVNAEASLDQKAYEPIIAELNRISESYQIALKSRRTRKAKEQDEEQNTDEQEQVLQED